MWAAVSATFFGRLRVVADLGYLCEDDGEPAFLAVAGPRAALPLLHLLDRGAHGRVEVLAVGVAHLHAYVGRETEVVQGQGGRGPDSDPLALLLEVDRLPFRTLVLRGVGHVAAARTDYLALLRVAYQLVAAVGTVNPEKSILSLCFPQVGPFT